jgi:predicted transcriptional regulator
MENLSNYQIKTIKKEFKYNTSTKFLRECMEIIGNEDRFLILNLLNNKPCLLADIEKSLNRSQASISHHIRILEKHKFIHSSKIGKFNEYTISRETFAKLLKIWNLWFHEIRTKDY